MMNKLLMLFAVSATVVGSAFANVTDIKLREILGRAVGYIDDPDGGPGEVCYAIRFAENDTNRVVSLMKQLVAEGAARVGITRFYLSEIGKYGTSSDLPFLYQRVSETNLCETATKAILKIEGLTTNSLMRFTTLIPDELPGVWNPWPVHAWCRLLEASKKFPADSEIRALTMSNAVQYATRQRESVELFDGCLKHADPTYRMSKRRLAVLRSVRDLGVNEYQTNYVTNAINELVAYPEANLPE